MPNIQEKMLDSQVMLFDREYFTEPSPEIFAAHYWSSQNKVLGKALGRGTTVFFEYQEQEFVLRQYLRGGLIGKVLHDQYLFTGIENSRAWQEFHLLQVMLQQGLPCPTPVAALVTKVGIYYRAAIILGKIPQAQDVFTQLLTAPLDEKIWQHIGHTISRFHQAQIYHHDLNIHNVMLDNQQQAWLIDFDKCTKKVGEKWKQDNLARLKRSLQKEQKLKNIHWQESDWQGLLIGYHTKFIDSPA